MGKHTLDTHSRHAQSADGAAHEAALLGEIERAARELLLAQSRAHGVQSELVAFLEQYYKKVAVWFDRMENHPGNAPAVQVQHAHKDDAPALHTLPVGPLNVKISYRKLVKLCHPDTASHPSTELLHQAQQAHASEDAALLYMLETSAVARALPAATRADYLRTRLNELHGALREATLHLRQLQNQPGYRLMQRVEQAREHGVDLVEQLAGDLKNRMGLQGAVYSTVS